jgi:hypothetical protein
MYAACPYLLILIDFIALIIFNEENYEAAHYVMLFIILSILLLWVEMFCATLYQTSSIMFLP